MSGAVAIRQSGSVTSGHAVSWTTDGVVQDAGGAGSGSLTSLGIISANLGALGIIDAAPSTGAYHMLGVGLSSADGHAVIDISNFGTSTPIPLVLSARGAGQITINPTGAIINFAGAAVSAIGSGLAVANGTLESTAGGGSVTSITAGAGLAGGVISTAGTISLATITAGRLMGNASASPAVPTAVSVGAGLTLATNGTLSASFVTAGAGLALVGGLLSVSGIPAGTTTELIGATGTVGVTKTIVLGAGLTLNAGTLSTGALGQWSAGAVTTVGAGLAVASSTISANWALGAVSALGTGLALASGTLSPFWAAGVVSTLGAGLTLTSGTLTTSPGSGIGTLVTTGGLTANGVGGGTLTANGTLGVGGTVTLTEFITGTVQAPSTLLALQTAASGQLAVLSGSVNILSVQTQSTADAYYPSLYSGQQNGTLAPSVLMAGPTGTCDLNLSAGASGGTIYIRSPASPSTLDMSASGSQLKVATGTLSTAVVGMVGTLGAMGTIALATTAGVLNPVLGSGTLSIAPPAQMGITALQATSLTAAGRMTTDGNTPGSTNSLPIGTGHVISGTLIITARNLANGDGANWSIPVLYKNVSSTVSVIQPGTTATAPSYNDSSLSTAAVTILADNTRKCLSVTIAPPTSGTISASGLFLAAVL